MNAINWRDYITINPAIMLGKPVIKNTRIPVDLIVEKLAFGESVSEILLDYPNKPGSSVGLFALRYLFVTK